MTDLPSDLRRKKPTVSLEQLREMFSYDPLTGFFTRNRRMGRFAAGTIAGGESAIHGYVFIGIDGQLYRAHRLAWLYHYGEWPPAGFEPDHKNTRRALRMWSNPGDVVFSPFMGIGSEGVVSMEEGRKFIGCELNPIYYRQAARNIADAESSSSFGSLFAGIEGQAAE